MVRPLWECCDPAALLVLTLAGEVVSDKTLKETLDNLGYITQEKEYDVGRAKRELQRYTKATNKEFK